MCTVYMAQTGQTRVYMVYIKIGTYSMSGTYLHIWIIFKNAMITHYQLLSFEYFNHRNRSNGERQNSWCLDQHSSHDIIVLFLFIYVVFRLLKKKNNNETTHHPDDSRHYWCDTNMFNIDIEPTWQDGRTIRFQCVDYEYNIISPTYLGVCIFFFFFFYVYFSFIVLSIWPTNVGPFADNISTTYHPYRTYKFTIYYK